MNRRDIPWGSWLWIGEFKKEGTLAKKVAKKVASKIK